MKLLQFGLCALCFAAPAQAEPPLVVEIVTVAHTDDTRLVSQTGEIVARNSLGVSFATGGRVVAAAVDNGDFVTAGMTLARLESIQQEQDLRAAQAGVSTANADHEQAKVDLKRQEALLERGAVTRTSRDEAEDNLHVTEGALLQAKSGLKHARKALSDTELLAPVDATVTGRSVDPGQVVAAAQPAFELALGTDMDAVFEVSEALLTLGGAMPEVQLASIDPPEKRFSGKVREVSPLVDPQTGTVTVTVGVGDLPEGVTYGDAVRGTVSRQQDPHVFLPYTAMSATSHGPAVWVVDPENMQVSIRSVTIERFETGRVVLSGGLEDGMLVVTKGAQLLYPGRVVRNAGVQE